MVETKTTRLPIDLLDAAEAEAAEEHRSTAKQVEHWARFGMFFSRQTTPSSRRIRQAIGGELPLADLNPDEAVVANAQINAAIATSASSTSFAERLAARGVTTIITDSTGRTVRRHPDGTTTPL
jgi:hypothetical protein